MSATLPAHLGRASTLQVALARALAMRPELLLLDDPLAGLDSGQSRWWRTLVESLVSGHPWLHGKPATVVIGTDTLRSMLGLGHRFALIDRGTWRILGDRQQVLDCGESNVREVLGDPS
jgi:ABC-type branched-subunit amino acid transport system ATPase component